MNPTATTQQTVTAPAQDTPERVAALRELAARDSVAAQDGVLTQKLKEHPGLV